MLPFSRLLGAVFSVGLLPATSAEAAITSFTQSPTSIQYSGSSTLTWVTASETSCSLTDPNNNVLSTALSGSVQVSPTVTSSYNLTCSPRGSLNRTVTVTYPAVGQEVQGISNPTWAYPSSTLGGQVLGSVPQGTLGIVIAGPVAQSSGAKAWQVAFVNTNTGTGSTEIGTGFNEFTGWVYGTSISPVLNTAPLITSFSANPVDVATGGSATLSWSTFNAATCVGSGGTGNGAFSTGASSPPNGSAAVSPPSATMYTLTCTAPDGTSQSVATTPVNVNVVPQIASWTATGPWALSGLTRDASTISAPAALWWDWDRDQGSPFLGWQSLCLDRRLDGQPA